MRTLSRFVFSLVAISLSVACTLVATNASSQQDVAGDAFDSEQLKIASLEALIAAPAQRALPIVEKVLAGNHSDRVKARALFLLGQIGGNEAHPLLIEAARDGSPALRKQAIRAIGISGNRESLAALGPLYREGEAWLRSSVLEAYLIADDKDAVFELAKNAGDDDQQYAQAVRTLGAMGASAELRKLPARRNGSASVIQAHAINGDFEMLRKLANQTTNSEDQVHAIRGLGMVGGDAAEQELVRLYRAAQSERIRDAALQGLMMCDHEQGVLALFRSSTQPQEKRKLLRMLVTMDSDAALELINETLDSAGGEQQ